MKQPNNAWVQRTTCQPCKIYRRFYKDFTTAYFDFAAAAASDYLYSDGPNYTADTTDGDEYECCIISCMLLHECALTIKLYQS
jgi:hypothetical protein